MSGDAGQDDVVTAVTADDHLLVITINRPDRRNSIDDKTAAGISAAVDRLESDPSLRVGVLTGAGGGFSAGYDLKAFLRGESAEVGEHGFAGLVKRQRTKPLVAAVEGYAIAGGFEMAIACDLLVVASDARLSIPEARRGLIADGGALLRLPRRVGHAVAMEMALTGREVSAERLAALGLINAVTTPGQALETALGLAREISSAAPRSVAVSLRVVNEAPHRVTEDVWAWQDELTASIWDSADAREGARAFAERRAPVFHGF